MNIDETPFDCFRVRCVFEGPEQEINTAIQDYKIKFPYIQYGTRVVKSASGRKIVQRFRTREICQEACIHVASKSPVSSCDEGKDHTVFQTY